MRGNVYTDKKICEFISDGAISSENKIGDGQIQPSSLDLRCGFGKKIWHMPYASIPDENLIDVLDSNSAQSFELDKKIFLHKNTVYVVELEEKLNLPEGISARSNPKSTTGRIDVHVRLITEDGKDFDNVREGYSGRLFLEIISNSFHLNLQPGYSFNQIRFFNGTKKLDSGMLEYLARSEDLLKEFNGDKINPENYISCDGAVYLRLNLDKEDSGYIARSDCSETLDLSSEKSSLLFSKYFQRVALNDEGLVIMPNSFYLLKSREIVKVPPDHCAEMSDISTNLGEFRSHYAGFFDPDWNDIAVMEVRNTSKIPFLLRDNQNISSLWFYNLAGEPNRLYGAEVGSNYQGQREIRPAKFFYNDLKPAK